MSPISMGGQRTPECNRCNIGNSCSISFKFEGSFTTEQLVRRHSCCHRDTVHQWRFIHRVARGPVRYGPHRERLLRRMVTLLPRADTISISVATLFSRLPREESLCHITMFHCWRRMGISFPALPLVRQPRELPNQINGQSSINGKWRRPLVSVTSIRMPSLPVSRILVGMNR